VPSLIVLVSDLQKYLQVETKKVVPLGDIVHRPAAIEPGMGRRLTRDIANKFSFIYQYTALWGKVNRVGATLIKRYTQGQ
jgi:hypothetical protein